MSQFDRYIEQVNTSISKMSQRGFNLEENGLSPLLAALEGLKNVTPEVLTTYPTTDASKAGQKFWYKGNEWEYLTQAKITALGWDAIAGVAVGFPAPVGSYNIDVLYPDGLSISISGFFTPSPPQNYVGAIDFIGLGVNVVNTEQVQKPSSPTTLVITNFRNAHLLKGLRSVGTQPALTLDSCSLSAETIDDLFTQLPSTLESAIISVVSNPGSATCDPTIATAKGYTVVTA